MTAHSHNSTVYDLVIIGFGMASHRLLQELGQLSLAPKRILVLGQEAVPAYNRVLLPQLIEDSSTDISLPALHCGQNVVTVLTNEKVVSISRQTQQLHTESDKCFVYRQLVFATGSAPVFPDFCKEQDIADCGMYGRILALRHTGDVAKISECPAGSHIVIQGGGFIALETAAALSAHYRVSVCHRGPYLMNRLLDDTASLLLQASLEQRGIEVLLQTEINGAKASPDKLQLAVSGPAGVRAVTADLLIAALGVTPRCELAKMAGISTNRGILVNNQMQSSDPDVFAIGECAECNDETIGLVAPVYQQAVVLAQVLSGQPDARYQANTSATNLKISGLAISTVGDIGALLKNTNPALNSLVYQDQQHGDYRRIWLLNGQLQGAILCGDTSLVQHYQQLMQPAKTANQTVASDDWLNSWLFQVA
jgi:nitrite reductase (NADH) large subunit